MQSCANTNERKGHKRERLLCYRRERKHSKECCLQLLLVAGAPDSFTQGEEPSRRLPRKYDIERKSSHFTLKIFFQCHMSMTSHSFSQSQKPDGRLWHNTGDEHSNGRPANGHSIQEAWPRILAVGVVQTLQRFPNFYRQLEVLTPSQKIPIESSTVETKLPLSSFRCAKETAKS